MDIKQKIKARIAYAEQHPGFGIALHLKNGRTVRFFLHSDFCLGNEGIAVTNGRSRNCPSNKTEYFLYSEIFYVAPGSDYIERSKANDRPL
jgi:hypothetical protein